MGKTFKDQKRYGKKSGTRLPRVRWDMNTSPKVEVPRTKRDPKHRKQTIDQDN